MDAIDIERTDAGGEVVALDQCIEHMFVLLPEDVT
jgi:hypothetical protein